MAAFADGKERQFGRRLVLPKVGLEGSRDDRGLCRPRAVGVSVEPLQQVRIDEYGRPSC